MEGHIITLLEGVGCPVAWGAMGPGATLPRIVVQTISGGQDVAVDGVVGVMRARIQVDSYGASQVSALDTSVAVRNLLSGYAGGPITFMRLTATRDRPATSGDDLVPNVSQDYELNYRP